MCGRAILAVVRTPCFGANRSIPAPVWLELAACLRGPLDYLSLNERSGRNGRRLTVCLRTACMVYRHSERVCGGSERD